MRILKFVRLFFKYLWKDVKCHFEKWGIAYAISLLIVVYCFSFMVALGSLFISEIPRGVCIITRCIALGGISVPITFWVGYRIKKAWRKSK